MNAWVVWWLSLMTRTKTKKIEKSIRPIILAYFQKSSYMALKVMGKD